MRSNKGFTLVEMMVTIAITTVAMLAFMGIFLLFQKSSSQNRHYADAQQNARIAVDVVTQHLRQAGLATDYVRGQRFVVYAEPYQVAFNADLDNGQTIGGQPPLMAIDRAFSPNTVPAGGTILYSPPRDYMSPAETVVFTLDSDNDGAVGSSDRGDDIGENGPNTRLYVLKRATYGSDGTTNAVQYSDVALVRGPEQDPDGGYPQPLFRYYYDHDDDPVTPNKLWGDDSPEDGELDDGEIAALSAMPGNLLPQIREIGITATTESSDYDEKYKDNYGFLRVSMQSEVHVRNAGRSGATIYGQVYHDVNADQTVDAGETGLPDVEVRLIGPNRSAITNSAGYYFIPVTPGDYTVREFDPAGFSSTTPNIVSISVPSGAAVQVDFGDEASGPIGVIRGTVWDDLDQTSTYDVGESGIADVLISLDSGEQITTDVNGDYSFIVSVGSYNVVETDPAGYGSTTPNAVTADVLAAGDTVVVNFGDAVNPNYGTIDGLVFEDVNGDGVRTGNESGIANVTLTLSSGDSTLTNASGYYQFSAPPGVYALTERDPSGYTSTTVNTYVGVVVAPDTSITLNFGDILINPDDYIEIVIGSTARALSVAAVDLKEDTKGDVDIIVGTPFSSGTGNLLVFHNERQNNNTAISALFTSTPTYQRDAGNNINTLATYDFSKDGLPDVLSGVQYNAGNNIQVWFDASGGIISNTPDVTETSSQSTYVMDSKVVDLNNDGTMDVVVGLATAFGTYTGGFEIFRGSGSGSLSSSLFVNKAGASSGLQLGEVWAIDAADIDGDGDKDIVVGSKTAAYSGVIDVYTNNGASTSNFTWRARYAAAGAINDLKLVDMMEDNAGDKDLLVGISSGTNQGALVLWLNSSGVFGKVSNLSFGPEVSARIPHDKFDAGGEVLSLDAAQINADVFPEVFVGTREGSFYNGQTYLLPTFGLLPTNGFQLSNSYNGEVVAMTMADFDRDNYLDVLVGTRTSTSQGNIIIYFNGN